MGRGGGEGGWFFFCFGVEFLGEEVVGHGCVVLVVAFILPGYLMQYL